MFYPLTVNLIKKVIYKLLNVPWKTPHHNKHLVAVVAHKPGFNINLNVELSAHCYYEPFQKAQLYPSKD